MAAWTAILVLLALGSLQMHVCDAQEEGAVRLVNGTSKNCGRVEIFHENVWGTVCDDRWGYVDADVVCKQLGYVRSEQRFLRAHFGQGTGPIWLDNVRCDSSHSSLAECPHRGWGVHNCKHKEDAGVCCKRVPAPKPPSLPVRLTCPECSNIELCKECHEKLHPDPTDCKQQPVVSGIVEVQVNGAWGPITAESWTANEAEVVCGELGYPITFLANADGECRSTTDDVHSVGILPLDEYIYPLTNEYIWPESVQQTSRSGSGDSEILCVDQQLNDSCSTTLLQELECSGKETNLLSCFFSGIGPQPNPTHRVAAVKCGFKPHNSCPPAETIRLRGGPVPWLGRVEVFKDGEWGTVCDTSFDVRDGNVVCRQLGYGSTKTIYSRAGSGRGVGQIHFADCQCAGTESSLFDCNCATGYKAEQCEHRGDVAIECRVPEKCNGSDDVRLSMFEATDPYHWWITYNYPRLNISGSESGLFCYSSTAPIVTKAVGEMICRETKQYFLSRIIKGTFPKHYEGSFYDGKIDCSGNETTISECSMNIYTVNGNCTDGYVVVDCTNVAADLVLDVDLLKGSLQSRHYIERLPMYYLRCALEERCLSSSAYRAPQTNERALLRFDSLAWNWGTDDFQPMASRDQWQWHSCHSHYHSMEDFVHYNLINETTGTKVAEGHKASFCLEDSRCVRSYSPRYSCGFGIQGISVNCGDLYGSYLDCQWIDVTGVPEGEYLLQLTANPNRLAVESDYLNNQANCRIRITAEFSSLTLEVDKCWLSDH